MNAPQLTDRRARHQRDQSVFHELLRRHADIRREVTEVPNGIRAHTWTDAPDLVPLLHNHAQEMHRRVKEKFGLRFWDPAFAELFAQADKVQMTVNLTENGVEVLETSDDPNVVKLIRAHGATVSAFVREGGRAASQESPLPDDYQRVLG
ncbi:hypothetical protein VK792_05895 [Mesobacterium sp. TK19101]|uniref:Uncharacterized protein n=1 Tax=Mesobacterium hydrothermale TaxID=3111907 RepID=A0ABU6HEC2_9RHOB|nr:hypothetical protein [Mesobacterium sp. TK19101]MEC3860809.1 hypothetical protein [Mesobacterium sp. TK19101]